MSSLPPMTPAHRGGGRRQARGERGIALVELVIAMGIGTVVGALAIYVLVTTLLTQTTVSGTTVGETRGQAAFAVLDRALRNGKGFTVTGTTQLTICTGTAGSGATTWERFAFSGGKLQHSRSGSATVGTLAEAITDASFTQSGRRLDYRCTLGRTQRTSGVVIAQTVVQRSAEAPCAG